LRANPLDLGQNLFDHYIVFSDAAELDEKCYHDNHDANHCGQIVWRDKLRRAGPVCTTRIGRRTEPDEENDRYNSGQSPRKGASLEPGASLGKLIGQSVSLADLLAP